MSDSDSSPSVDVSSWNNLSTPTSSSDIHLKLDQPIDLTGHILSPFYAREFNYQDCRFNSVAHLMCYRNAVLHGLKTFATAVHKWANITVSDIGLELSVSRCFEKSTATCV